MVSGELARVWIARRSHGESRALVGVLGDRGRAEIERRAAARALGLPEVAVAALVYGPELTLVAPLTPDSAGTP